MTQEGFDKLQEELHHLRTVGRAEVSEKIRVARGFGDLSENSEYDEAKNDQAVMEARIAQLEEQLKHVEIIDHDDITTDAVSVGSRVKILDVEYGDEMTYRIVSSLESGGEGETITDESPVGGCPGSGWHRQLQDPGDFPVKNQVLTDADRNVRILCYYGKKSVFHAGQTAKT